MTKEDILMLAGEIPLTERAFQIHGHKERGINYCVVSRYKNDGFIHSKIEHMVTDDLDLLDLNKKSVEISSLKKLDDETTL
ncbi:MAG: hypothetical protein ACLUFN_07405 [Eubacterium sp.]